MNEALKLSEEVAAAVRADDPVVALETTLVAHGFPAGAGLDVALECEARVRDAGAVPASIGLVDGTIRIGLDPEELGKFAEAGDAAAKVGPRDLAAAVVGGRLGATTIGGTLSVCRATGIRFMGTGGLGGVHRGFAETLDVSADLGELARTQALVVASGPKSLLDVAATAEVLETLGVPVLGLGIDTIPRFYDAAGGPSVSARVESPEEAARVASLHWSLGRPSGVFVGNPPAESLDVEPLIEEAVAAARGQGVAGQDVTPFVLAHIHRASGGRTIDVNRRLIVDNAGVAGEIAAAYAALG